MFQIFLSSRSGKVPEGGASTHIFIFYYDIEGSFLILFLFFCSIHIRDQLVKHGWCLRISHYLQTVDYNDFDQIEKILIAMIPLTDACRMDFLSLLPILDKLNDIYTKNHLNDDSTYIDILINIQNLRTTLQQTSSIDL